jgi:hypothetical protein
MNLEAVPQSMIEKLPDVELAVPSPTTTAKIPCGLVVVCLVSV